MIEMWVNIGGEVPIELFRLIFLILANCTLTD